MGTLDPEIKEDWIEALLSGDHEQTRGRLEDVNTGEQCCLGVLCDILDLPRTVVIPTMAPGGGTLSGYVIYGEYDGCVFSLTDDDYGTNFSSGTVPEKVAKDIGLRQIDQNELAYLNDKGTTFEEIADWIEVNL